MKILIRLPNWLGDVVMSTAFVNAVVKLYPGSEINVIIKKELAEIANLIPGIAHVYPFSKKEYPGLTGAYRFGKKLRAQKFDLFFNLPSSISSTTLAWSSRARKRIGYSNEGGSILLNNAYTKPLNLHRVNEYLWMLEQFNGITITDAIVKLETRKTASNSNKLVLINFNSEASSRKMPLLKAQQLLNTLTNTFKAYNFGLIGAKKESDFVGEIIEGVENPGNIHDFSGKTSLTGLAELMAGSKVLLTTDSGPAHLANSLNIPVIVLFGAGDEHNTAPFNTNNLHVIRAGQLACEPCLSNTCKLYGVPKCLELIETSKIISILNSYL